MNQVLLVLFALSQLGSAFVMGTNTPACGDAFVRTFWHWNLCVPIIYTHSLMYYWIFPRLYGV